MDELKQAVEKLLAAQPQKLVLSAPRTQPPRYRRAAASRVKQGWQLENLTQDKAFHQNFGSDAELAEALVGLLCEDFFQLAAFTQTRQLALRVSKKGKVLTSSSALAAPAAAAGAGPAKAATPGKLAMAGSAPAHDRQKRRPLKEGEAIAPLVDIGVMTKDGRVVASMQDKWRQINRFVELVDDALKPPPAPDTPDNPDAPDENGSGKKAKPTRPLRVVDFGCGKSYLTFVLYHYLVQQGYQVEMTGLDLKAEVVAHCNAAAEKYGYTGLRFAVGDIAEYTAGAPVDMVVTLHACDTATDFALAKAVQWGCGMIFSVPCCQHELNGQMRSEPLNILTRYGLVKERSAALFTDAIRANLLAACGYKAQLVEFVGFEHTPKNIMIRAVKTRRPAAERQKMLDEVQRLCGAFELDPCLLRLLKEAGRL